MSNPIVDRIQVGRQAINLVGTVRITLDDGTVLTYTLGREVLTVTPEETD